MELGIEGKVALVTAASKGLGRACAEDLAREGCRVVICSRNAAELERTAREITAATGNEVRSIPADVSQPDQVTRLLEQVRGQRGDADILITNAGGPPPGTFATTPPESFQAGFDLTLMSAVRLIHGVVPSMKEKGWGRIILVTSISVKQPFGNLMLSNVFRSGVTAFMKTAAGELASTGITLNAVLPGVHKTDRVVQIGQKRVEAEGLALEQVFEEMTKPIPMGRMGDPGEFSGMVAFLASQRASFITGTSILVDGGHYTGLL